LDLKPGLRNEYTTTNADFQNVTIPSYNTLVPSMVLSHKFNDAQSIKLSYNYRIQRPDYRDVNPFYNISDPYNISTGNPNLKPEKSNSLELGFNQSFNSGASFSAGVFYRHNSDDLQDYSTRYDVLTINGRDYYDVLLSQRANIGTQTSVGGNIFASVPVTDKLNLRSNIFLISRNNNNPGIANVTGFGYRINLNASYQFGKDLTAEAFGNYNSSQRVLQGTRPQFFFYNFAVRKQFMDKKASIGLMATNPFGLYVNQRSVTEGVGFRQNNLRQLPFQSFGITLSYKFGKLEFSKNKGDRGNQEGGDNMPQAPEGGTR
jgi:outer membrane receptor protein involved in Fe transport